MDQEIFKKIQQIDTKRKVVEGELIALKNQIHFIEKANKHNITVECVTMVPDPCPDSDDWGWSGPPMKERREVRNYSIDKEILLSALKEQVEGKRKLLAQFKKEFDEL